MNSSDISSVLQRVREENPLVHNITNVVVTNFTANGLLSLGASPVMANAPEEAADMVRISRALVLNIGTLNKDVVNSMILAGKKRTNSEFQSFLIRWEREPLHLERKWHKRL